MIVAAASTDVIATLKMQVNSSDQQCCISSLLFLWKVSYLAGQSSHVFSTVTTPIIHYLNWFKWPRHFVALCSWFVPLFMIGHVSAVLLCVSPPHDCCTALPPIPHPPGDSALIHKAFIGLLKIVFFFCGTLLPWVRLACVLVPTSGQIPVNYLNQHSWASVCQCR